MNNLLSLDFWFSTNPVNLGLWGVIIFLVLVVAMLGVGIFFIKSLGKKQKFDKHTSRGYVKLGGWFMTWSLIVLFWLFCAYERISLFGAAFWLVIFLICAAIWLVYIILYFKKTIPSIKGREQEAMERMKYLPKRKK